VALLLAAGQNVPFLVMGISQGLLRFRSTGVRCAAGAGKRRRCVVALRRGGGFANGCGDGADGGHSASHRRPGGKSFFKVQLPGILKAGWPEIENQPLQGRYQPQPVRRRQIPKPPAEFASHGPLHA
jgi:hypothetical protein